MQAVINLLKDRAAAVKRRMENAEAEFNNYTGLATAARQFLEGDAAQLMELHKAIALLEVNNG